MCGGIPLFPYVPLWRGQGDIYSYSSRNRRQFFGTGSVTCVRYFYVSVTVHLWYNNINN